MDWLPREEELKTIPMCGSDDVDFEDVIALIEILDLPCSFGNSDAP